MRMTSGSVWGAGIAGIFAASTAYILSSEAYDFGFNNDGFSPSSDLGRYAGFTVRK